MHKPTFDVDAASILLCGVIVKGQWDFPVGGQFISLSAVG